MTRMSNPESARAFLEAYWRADLSGALGLCTSGATVELARSLPFVTPAPVAEILPRIFRDVYPRFEGGRFDVTIDRMISDEQGVVVEYTARGKLTNGTLFGCGYAAVLEFVAGKIERVRMYTDTRYVAAALMS